MIILFIIFGTVIFLFAVPVALCKNVAAGALMGVSGILLIYFTVNVDYNKHPEKQYENLLQNVEKANEELQKFYIDHLEFKENN